MNKADSDIIAKRIKAGSPATWVFTGDSITHGVGHTNGFRSYSEHFAERIRWELHRVHDIVINTGVSGDTAGKILESFDWRICRFDPDIVSVMIGTNDAALGQAGRGEFRRNLVEIINRVRQTKAIMILNTPNTICIEGYDGSRKDLCNYVQMIREIASEYDVVLIDHWQYWQLKKTDEDDLTAWLDDSIHPNEYGHRALARVLFKELGIFSPDSPTCQLIIP